jgi:membrane-associated phospholipid phosphatase
MDKCVRGCESAKLWLGVALCAGGLSLASASAQLVRETTLPEAPSTLKQSEPPASRLWFQDSGEPPQQDHPQSANRPDSDRNLVGIIKRGVRDQKEIYAAPFHRQNLKWDALFLVATGGLIAVDRHAAGAISHNNLTISQHISDVGLYSTMATTGVLYLSGLVRKDDHARESGFLGFEAFGNTLVVDAVTQLITGRERPLEGSGHGRFWVNNAFNSSFPSQHSGLTWSMASVLAHEYPRTWVQFLAYGTAATVSVTRVTGLEHFPADVAVGGVFGYFIGQHIFHAHSHFFHSRPHMRSDYLDQEDRSSSREGVFRRAE